MWLSASCVVNWHGSVLISSPDVRTDHVTSSINLVNASVHGVRNLVDIVSQDLLIRKVHAFEILLFVLDCLLHLSDRIFEELNVVSMFNN